MIMIKVLFQKELVGIGSRNVNDRSIFTFQTTME